METRYTLRHYLTEDGSDVIIEWLRALHDRRAVSRVIRRLDRVRSGNFGDHKPAGEGVWELRIHYGPGYRIYYCFDGEMIVLLLAGGDKSTQTEDILTARRRKADYEGDSL